MDRRKQQISLIALVGWGMLGACDIEDPQECQGSARQIVETDEVLEGVVDGNTGFALELYRELVEEDENFFFSPFSLSLALGMSELGADGTTAEEMREVLGIPADESPWHAAIGGLGSDIGSELHCDYELALANRLFSQMGYPIQQSYLDAAMEYYEAPVEQMDFAGDTEGSREHINAWVAEITRDKISEALPPGLLTPQTVMVLVNAIYFKGDWMQPFDEASTNEQGIFVQEDGTELTTPIMWGEMEEARYAEVENAQILELPYKGDELSMIIALPNPGVLLSALEAELSAADITSWNAALQPTPVFVSLPKFEMRSAATLNTALEALGMEKAFIPGEADFGRKVDPGSSVYISSVIHEAYVKVDEKGTEAAAVTVVVDEPTSAPAYPYFQATRPFLFQIQDQLTGSVLFMGRVVDPTEKAD